MRRAILILTISGFLLTAAILLWFFWTLKQPLNIPENYILDVPKGATLTRVAHRLADDGILPHPFFITLPMRFTDGRYTIKAGRYRFANNATIADLLEKLAAGVAIPVMITFTEGMRFEEFKRVLRNTPDITNTVLDLPDSEILRAIGASEAFPEGLFFPDTYHIAAGSSDISLLKNAYREMQVRLSAAWEKRRKDLPLATPYEALILASIVEKETGHDEDRLLIASVFVNRLRIGMRLQADPTVIYGMGDRYQGKIRRRDLDADTPYNTYTRAGLPPTPIASVSQASLDAVMQAPKNNYLYFVAHSDKSGSSVFSETLNEHNRAVRKHILGRN